MNPGQKIIERFMVNGKFATLPVQRKRRKYILEHILKQFDLNRIYTEQEISEKITEFHDDYCRVRRDFVDEKMMYRKDGKYRRNASYKFASN